jgi:hypothetical protein
MCGMGRTGSLFAIEQEGVSPDIITIAKGLGAGYQPISSVLANERITKEIEANSGLLWNGHTYMSHGIACAAALAVVNVIQEENLLENVRRQGEKLKELMRDRFKDHPHVGDIRGRGLFWAIEIVADKPTKTAFPAEHKIADKIKANAFSKGLLCYPTQGCADGKNGDHVLLAPVYTVTDDELSYIVETLYDVINSQIDSIKKAA